MDIKNSVIGETCAIGIMTYITEEFGVYLEKELKRRKIPIQRKHAGLFMILFFKSNKIEFKELAHIWRKSKSTLCDITSKYADQKLIKKTNCCSDKRNVYIEITEEGLKYKKDFDEISGDFLEKATSTLSKDKVEELKFILDKMIKVFI
ncbi:MarR family winged helix-turn-helix transcriptional regulator [uncultured Ilyobacter sp.]|uniref:MarR family winged helix-turn-helix transcriptional regulator n=1 Tax=uncultured Ilyobacter sp. TaxID=544433 RepID=UPI0029F54DCE|nr:MarR family winged helix-turn-helix transcriptional regulator [uncultured Ilyobacter sp.]